MMEGITALLCPVEIGFSYTFCLLFAYTIDMKFANSNYHYGRFVRSMWFEVYAHVTEITTIIMHTILLAFKSFPKLLKNNNKSIFTNLILILLRAFKYIQYIFCLAK